MDLHRKGKINELNHQHQPCTTDWCSLGPQELEDLLRNGPVAAATETFDASPRPVEEAPFQHFYIG